LVPPISCSSDWSISSLTICISMDFSCSLVANQESAEQSAFPPRSLIR
jgi:hypothetical protein